MSKQSVIIDYSKVPDNDLDNFADAVLQSLDQNVNFTFKEGDLAGLGTKTERYKETLGKTATGGTYDRTTKNLAKKDLVDVLRYLAMEVNKQADGDINKLSSTAFKLVKEKSKVGILPKPTGFKLTSGHNDGDIRCTVDANANANVYNFYYAPVPAPEDINDWRIVVSTTRIKNITGLVPGKQYVFRCAYQGTETTLVYSDPISVFAH